MFKVKVMTWILFMVQLHVKFFACSATTNQTTKANTTASNTTASVTEYYSSTSNNNVTQTTTFRDTTKGESPTTKNTSPIQYSTTSTIQHSTISTIQHSTTSTIQDCTSTNPSLPGLDTLIVMSAAGGVVVLSVVWSIFVCWWYRRKLNRLLTERKSENDAEKGVLLHEMNGRKTSAVTYRGEIIDKDLSSGVMSTHSKVEDNDERMSDLYDVTDPDYEDADKEIKIMVSEKPRKINDDDEIEDGEYDILNVEDKKTQEKRESDYACAEFKSSKDDVDSDTYDTTDTCKRIVCDRDHKHENCETENPLENSGFNQSEVQDAAKYKNTDTSESNGQKVNSENKTVVSKESKDAKEAIKFQENTNLNNNEEKKSIKSDEKGVKKEIGNENISTFNGYELVKLVDEKDDSVKSDARNSTGDTKKDEALEKIDTSLETIEV